jgi:hypothetical protein
MLMGGVYLCSVLKYFNQAGIAMIFTGYSVSEDVRRKWLLKYENRY